jgi:hypothetical protein
LLFVVQPQNGSRRETTRIAYRYRHSSRASKQARLTVGSINMAMMANGNQQINSFRRNEESELFFAFFAFVFVMSGPQG